MGRLHITESTIIFGDEVKKKFSELPEEEREQLICDNTEVIKTSSGEEMLTFLVVVENDKLVSKKDADEVTKRKLADEQYELLKGDHMTPEFRKALNKQLFEAVKAQRKIIISEGRTAIIISRRDIYEIDIPYKVFKTIVASIILLFASWAAIKYCSTNTLLLRFNMAVIILNMFVIWFQMIEAFAELLRRSFGSGEY
jgi:hypothetical protein